MDLLLPDLAIENHGFTRGAICVRGAGIGRFVRRRRVYLR